MRVNYRVTPFRVIVFSALILSISGYFLVQVARETFAHVTTDARPATIVDAEDYGRGTSRGSRRQTSLTFELNDGSTHSDLVNERFLWSPSVGETIHVYEAAPGNWEVSEEFSWPGTIGQASVFLIPWLLAILKVWEWAEKALFPERWAESQRRDRERRRAAMKDAPTRDRNLSRRQRAKAQRRASSGD